MYCARCGEAFHTNSAWEEHSRQIEMCSIVDKARLDIFFTYMSDKQEAKISHGISWSGMYKVLFPDDAVPDNSCKFRYSCRFSLVYQQLMFFALVYEDSEALVFSLIDESHGSMGSSLRVFEAYRQNQRAESTCSARTALHYGWIATSTLSEAFQPSDSGYSAPEEYPPAGGPSALLVEDPDPVPQEHDSTCAAAAAHSSTTVPQHNADIDEGHLL